MSETMMNGAARRAPNNNSIFLKTNPSETGVMAANDAASAAPAAALAPSMEPSVISMNAELTGSISTPDELRIFGKISGNVRAAKIWVCAGGLVKGDVIAETVVAHGNIEGRVFGNDVRLCAGANVNGDVKHRSLGIDPAANFEGSVKRVENPLEQANS